MYLGHYPSRDPQELAGLFSKIKKAVKKVAAPVLKPLAKIENKLVATFVPKKLEPLAERIAASNQRVNELLLVPMNAPAILKAEVKQMKDAVKDPEFMKLVGTIVSVVAMVYPFLQPIAAAMNALQVAAEITAAKKLNAKNAAEAQAAQAEFDAYAAQLAKAVQEGEKLKAAQQAALQQGVQQTPVVLTPENQSIVNNLQPGFFAPGGEGSTSQPLPTWALTAAGVAVVGAIVLARKRRGL